MESHPNSLHTAFNSKQQNAFIIDEIKQTINRIHIYVANIFVDKCPPKMFSEFNPFTNSLIVNRTIDAIYILNKYFEIDLVFCIPFINTNKNKGAAIRPSPCVIK